MLTRLGTGFGRCPSLYVDWRRMERNTDMNREAFTKYIDTAHELAAAGHLHDMHLPVDGPDIEWTDMNVTGDSLKKGDLVLDRVKNETHRTIESLDRKDVWGTVTFVGGVTSRIRLDATVNIQRPVEDKHQRAMLNLDRRLREMLDELCKSVPKPVTFDLVDEWRIYNDLENTALKHAMFHSIVQPIIGGFVNDHKDGKQGRTFLLSILYTVQELEDNLRRFRFTESSTSKWSNLYAEATGKVAADWLSGYGSFTWSSVQYYLTEVYGDISTKALIKILEDNAKEA